jgi:hypothetical protein
MNKIIKQLIVFVKLKHKLKLVITIRKIKLNKILKKKLIINTKINVIETIKSKTKSKRI